MEPQSKSIYVVRSVWRRLKNGRITKIGRDLEPLKDVKGGGGYGQIHTHQTQHRRNRNPVISLESEFTIKLAPRFGVHEHKGDFKEP